MVNVKLNCAFVSRLLIKFTIGFFVYKKQIEIASVRPKTAQHTALARDCAALIWAWRCRGGWKQRQGSRLQRPLTASMQTVTVPSSLAVTESAGCAKRHSDSARLHAPRWNSRHTYSRHPAKATAAIANSSKTDGTQLFKTH